MSRTLKYNEEIQAKIVERANLGIPSAVISKEFNISRPTLTKILKAHGIVRKVGKPVPLKIYYSDPIIVLTEESHKKILNELNLQNVTSAYLLSKRTNIPQKVADQFFAKGQIPIGMFKEVLNNLHIYTTLIPVSEKEDGKDL